MFPEDAAFSSAEPAPSHAGRTKRFATRQKSMESPGVSRCHPGSASRRPRAEREACKLRLWGCLAEVLNKMRVPSNPASIISAGVVSKLIHELAPCLLGNGWWREVAPKNRAGVLPKGINRQRLEPEFHSDHFALLGHSQSLFQRARWLRQQCLMGWRTASPDGAAATVEQL